MDLWGFLADCWQAVWSDAGIETLKTLFDGMLGASLGALVAVVVLKRTLREQRRGLAAQLDAQEEHFSRQLKMQQESLAEELHAQTTENVRHRQRDIASEIIGLLVELHVASKVFDNPSAITSLGNSLIVNVTRLRLDCSVSEEPFCDVLEEWTRHLTRCALRISTSPKPWSEEEEFTEVTEVQRSHVVRLLTDWCRGAAHSRTAITSLLEASLSVEQRDGGRMWRFQIAPETLPASNADRTNV